VGAVKVSIQDTTVGGSSCWNGATFTAACPNYVAAGYDELELRTAAGAGATNAHAYTAHGRDDRQRHEHNTAADDRQLDIHTRARAGLRIPRRPTAPAHAHRPDLHRGDVGPEHGHHPPAASAFTVVVGGSGDTVTGVTMTDATHSSDADHRAYGNNVVINRSPTHSPGLEPGTPGQRRGTRLPPSRAQTVTNTAPAALVRSTLGCSPHVDHRQRRADVDDHGAAQELGGDRSDVERQRGDAVHDGQAFPSTFLELRDGRQRRRYALQPR
jgi:hypothetical protein